MNKLFGFGDSCTQGHKINSSFIKSYKDWYVYRGNNFPPVWIDIVADYFGYMVKNYGHGGSGNQQIFHDFVSHMNEIKEGDMVIINWSYLTRFRWPSTYEEYDKTHEIWNRVSIHDYTSDPLSKELKYEILNNRTRKLYQDEVYDYERIIEKIASKVGFDVFFWSIENDSSHST